MKKVLVATILGLATVVSTMAQGRIALDTYNAAPTYPPITYGAGANGTLGATVESGYTIGVFYSLTAATFTDPSGIGAPSGSFLLATGAGATTPVVAGGLFAATGDFTVPGWVSGPVFVVVVAYTGSTYADAAFRGHSSVFSVTPAINTDAAPKFGGMSPFSVLPVPEPSTFALAGLGLASLLIFRRRK